MVVLWTGWEELRRRRPREFGTETAGRSYEVAGPEVGEVSCNVYVSAGTFRGVAGSIGDKTREEQLTGLISLQGTQVYNSTYRSLRSIKFIKSQRQHAGIGEDARDTWTLNWIHHFNTLWKFLITRFPSPRLRHRLSTVIFRLPSIAEEETTFVFGRIEPSTDNACSISLIFHQRATVCPVSCRCLSFPRVREVRADVRVSLRIPGMLIISDAADAIYFRRTVVAVADSMFARMW